MVQAQDTGASAGADQAFVPSASSPAVSPVPASIPSANEPNWYELAKALAVAVMFQRGTRSVHVVGRNGKVTHGCVDLLGGYAVDDLARKFCAVAGVDFEDIEPPTEHEAMFMLMAGMTWLDWLEQPRTIRAKALGTGHPSKVDHGRLAQAIEARRAETAGPVHESVVPAGNAPQVTALTPPDDQEGEGDRG